MAGLVSHLRECLQDQRSKADGRVLHLAHSQGALITALASKHLTAAEKARIEVLTFGAAQSVDASAGFKRAVNYYAMNDPVLYVDVAAARAWSFLDKAVVDAAMASGCSSMEDEVAELEALLQAAVTQRRWHACVEIQAALDIIRGQVRVRMQTAAPASTDAEADPSSSRLWAKSEALEAAGKARGAPPARRLRSAGGEAELVFCRPVRFKSPLVSLLFRIQTFLGTQFTALVYGIWDQASGVRVCVRTLLRSELLLTSLCMPRQLSSSALDAHTLLGPTYWTEIVREARRTQSEELERSLVGRARLRFVGLASQPPPPTST